MNLKKQLATENTEFTEKCMKHQRPALLNKAENYLRSLCVLCDLCGLNLGLR